MGLDEVDAEVLYTALVPTLHHSRPILVLRQGFHSCCLCERVLLARNGKPIPPLLAFTNDLADAAKNSFALFFLAFGFVEHLRAFAKLCFFSCRLRILSLFLLPAMHGCRI